MFAAGRGTTALLIAIWLVVLTSIAAWPVPRELIKDDDAASQHDYRIPTENDDPDDSDEERIVKLDFSNPAFIPGPLRWPRYGYHRANGPNIPKMIAQLKDLKIPDGQKYIETKDGFRFGRIEDTPYKNLIYKNNPATTTSTTSLTAPAPAPLTEPPEANETSADEPPESRENQNFANEQD